ncbi:MAG: hypothetical protein MZW92_30520 [Comamonadaceae bacterium]|nr:hypothetical protein [Comamonadaceae bacterium]
MHEAIGLDPADRPADAPDRRPDPRLVGLRVPAADAEQADHAQPAVRLHAAHAPTPAPVLDITQRQVVDARHARPT